MRICFYTETALPRIGGQEMVVDALARQFQAQGHDIRVLAPRPRGLDFDDSDCGYPVLRHPPFYSTRRFLGWYARGLTRLYQRWPFDILHCHSVYPTAYLAALGRGRIDAPLVVTSHGGDVREGNSRMRKPGIRARHAQGVAAADALIAISDYTRTGYERLSPGAGPVIAIPNGVDIDKFAEPVSRPTNLPPVIGQGGFILCLGRMHPQKGGDVLIKAFAIAQRQRPTNTQLVFAGGGPMRSEWEALARAEGIQNKCHFTGFVTGDTKTWLLQNTLCTVVPTREWEAFGLSVIESFAAGRPVIGSQLPGLADLISPNETGLIVAPNDPQQLAMAILQVSEDEEFAHRLGRAARQEAQQYHWPRIAAAHLDLYEELVSARRSQAA